MYTIISATNRIGSHTEKVAFHYQNILNGKGLEVNFFTLQNLNVLERNPALTEAENKYLIPAEKFIIIMPEYNGSFPGAFKALIDISNIRQTWWYKKALLTGVSSGRAGNLRGMDQMTGILNYLKMIVYHNKLPISVIDRLMDEDGVITDPGTLQAIDQQVNEFIQF